MKYDLVMPRVPRGVETKSIGLFSRPVGDWQKIDLTTKEIALFFQREGGYDCTSFRSGLDTLWLTGFEYDKKGDLIECVIGACQFAQAKEGIPMMRWIWIHPFERGGFMKRCFPELKEIYGDFTIFAPYSRPMYEFVKKHPELVENGVVLN